MGCHYGKLRTKTWIERLKEEDISEYEFCELPEELRDFGSHMDAVRNALVVKIKISNAKNRTSKWRVC